MASIPTSTVIQMRDRIFILPNLVLWIMVWPLAYLSDFGNVILMIPFNIMFLVMNMFVVYDRKKIGGWSAAMRPLYESTPIRRTLLAVVLIVVVIVLWAISVYNENLSWLGWNSFAACNLCYSFLIIPGSSNTPE